jgi:hypothetical protein
MRLSILIIVSLIVLPSCSTKLSTCKTVYRLDKIDQLPIRVNRYGGLYKKDRRNAFLLIKRLRMVEDYYYSEAEEMK